MQTAFVELDGFPCGYCTPGQICPAIAMLAEARAGWPSHATSDVASPHIDLTNADIRGRNRSFLHVYNHEGEPSCERAGRFSPWWSSYRA
jgi:aerobic-type carbon monoxide dehydrogenase small subunit (CoxS/CutS family)